MSIAIALQIHPSPTLRALRGLTAMAVVLLAGVIMAGWLEIFSSPWNLLIALACATCACMWFWWGERRRRVYQIDISGAGQIRLAQAAVANMQFSALQSVQLLANSTFWPQLMVLRLQTEDGAPYQVLVLPDSTKEFRALAVALRWIIQRTPNNGL